MALDLSRSRRGYHEYCKWWSRNKNEDLEDSELVMKFAPTGTFYAKEISPETDEDNVYGGAFLTERTSVVLKSKDNLYGIEDKDLVLYNENLWRVTSIQKKKVRKQSSEFLKDEYAAHDWIINLRR